MSQSIYLRSSLARIIALGVVGGTLWSAGVVATEASGADTETGRVYELVSPADKGGQGVYFSPGAAKVGITRAAVDGNAAVYTSWGSFGDAQGGLPMSYRASRTAAGVWISTAVSPPPHGPDPDVPIAFSHAPWEAAGRDLGIGYALTSDPIDPTDVNGRYDVYEVGPGGHAELVSRGNGPERADETGFEGALGRRMGVVSADGRHAVFSTASHLIADDVGRAENADLYERYDGHTYLVNQTDAGDALINRCGSRVPVETERNTISADGSRIIFETPADVGADPDCSVPTEIYMRVDRARTIHISASQRTPGETPQAKLYRGASADGDVVFFSSNEKLTDEVDDSGLYRYTVSTDRLELIVPDNGLPGLTGVVKISADGTRVFFTSLWPFTPDAGFGEPNLYYADEDGISLIATDRSGIGFDSDVASRFEPARPANVTPDGDRLLFVSRVRLTGFDTAGRNQAYLYDVSESRLTCISCDPAGQRPVGSQPVSDARIRWELETSDDTSPAITPDGATVVFDTSDRLIAGDTNARRDVYEYANGRLSLVTTGRANTDAALVGIVGGGRDVFFTTAATLVGTDVDGGNVDIYDARIGGTPPPVPPDPRQSCLGDSCQGAAEAAPHPDPLGSEFLASDGQVNEEEPPTSKKSLVVTRPSRAAQRRLAQSGHIVLQVRTSGGGLLRIRATGRVNGRSRVVASATKRVSQTGKVSTRVRVQLTSAARRALARGATLHLRFVVQLAGVQPKRTISMQLKRNRR